jgi:TolA-binding protein
MSHSMISIALRLACLVVLVAGAAVDPADAAVSTPDRLWAVGVQAFEDGLYDVTYRELGRFIQAAPTDPRRGDATLLRGKAAFALKSWADALAEFQAGESLPLRAFTPGEPIFWQAEVHFRLRRFEQARERYSALLRDYPRSPYAPDALYARGFSELELGLPDDALATFGALLAQHPTSELAGSAAYASARELVRAKRWEEAYALLSSYASRFPRSRFLTDTQYLLGVVQMETGRTAEAARTLESWLASNRTQELAPTARVLLAEAQTKSGRAREAIDQYRALLRDAPTHPLVPQALYQIGDLSSQLGRSPDAETAWKTLRRDYPRDPLAELAGLELVNLYVKRRQLEPAVAMAREVADARGGQRFEALLLLGETALNAGKTVEAQTAYATAIAEAPPESGGRYRALAGAGRVAEALKDQTGARQAYQEIIDKGEDVELVKWATERVQTLEARELAREQERQRLEQERLEREKQELERQEREKLEAEKQERERQAREKARRTPKPKPKGAAATKPAP